ncbi:MAG: radical SAM protein [Oscillospiraceae bacterium]|nr:radical SAM protein [Oscillospiraceae bacterium]
MNNLKVMFVRVSENCNAGCFMCGFAKNSNSYNITREQFENLLKEMKEIGTYEVVRFTGGEPLLHPDLPYFIKKCIEEGYQTSIITNGYLMPKMYKELIDAGISQVIFSLDGSCAEVHDKLRNLKGAFDNIINATKLLKKAKKDIIIRVNTVVSALNINDMKDILNVLVKNDIDQWSIIPLRAEKNLWNNGNIEEYIKIYKDFEKTVSNIEKPKMLGYSKKWAGRNEEEIKNLFYHNKFYHPNGKCHLVNRVRFYIPDKEELIPCNCASHRTEQIGINHNKNKLLEDRAKIIEEWLMENGPHVCTGCEPLNVYLAEHSYILDNDIFSF